MGQRTCQDCREQFDQTPGEKNIRCHACREKRRIKKCRGCSAEYRDGSEKNTRRYCDGCREAKKQRSGNRRTKRLDRRRSRRVRSKEGGRADDLKSMTPFTNSWWGRVGEKLYHHLFPDASDAVDEYGNKASYDFDHREHGRVNVKTAKQSRTRHGKETWSFQLEGSEHCDRFFLVGLDEAQRHVVRAWFGAASVLPRRLKKMTPESREYSSQAMELESSEVAVLDRKLGSLLADVSDTPVPCTNRSRALQYDRILVGHIGEAVYAKTHPDADHVAARDPLATWDFTDTDGTTVNVRVRRPAKDRDRWTFFRSPGCTASVYHFYGVDHACKTVLAAYRVPATEMPENGFSVAQEGSSKWNRYRLDMEPTAVSDYMEVEDLDAIHIEIHGVSRVSLDSMSPGELEGLLRRAARYHRALGFPFPRVPTEAMLESDLRRIRGYKPEGKILHQDNAGLGVSSGYMPNRFKVRNASADFSAFEAFVDNDRLQRALRFALRGNDPGLTRNRLRGALTALNRTPTQFRPTVTHALIQALCPTGGLVLDPCAGWGGRLMGTVVAERRYVGVEPVKETADNLYRLGARLSEHGACDRSDFSIVNSSIEEADLAGIEADFAITSPPYAGQEEYEGLAWKSFVAWRAGFLPLLFAKVREHLRSGGRFAVNIRDVRRGREELPLEKATVQAGEGQGFFLEDVWRMEIGSFGRQASGRSEPILVFRRS